MEEKEIFELLVEKEEYNWKTLLKEAIRAEEMNPWDIDISQLTNRYVEMVDAMKKLDFSVSGKVLLASSLLLRMKSNKLVDEDIDEFDQLISNTEESMQQREESEFFSEFDQSLFEEEGRNSKDKSVQGAKITPKTPHPRERKVTIDDLASSLEQAMKTKKRNVDKKQSKVRKDVEPPENEFDISSLITSVYDNIKGFFKEQAEKILTFTKLLPSDSDKEEKVHTLIPLLHLDHQGKINIQQDEPFGEITIKMEESQE